MKKKVTLSLDIAAADILQQSGGARGQADYVARVVTDRWREWRQALAYLRSQATDEEIKGAVLALGGAWLSGFPDQEAMVLRLDALPVDIGDLQWRVKNRNDQRAAWALWVVAKEWWASYACRAEVGEP